MTEPAARTAALQHQLRWILNGTAFAAMRGHGPLQKYEGKVRDCYIDASRGQRILIATDRLSAFDRIITTLPSKGHVLSELSQFWFEQTKHIAPNHVIATPDPCVTIAKECRPIAAEFVVRAYLTGVTSTSIWHAYQRGDRTYCGYGLPDGMRKNEPLLQPILTPSTKAPKGGHDISVSRADLLAMGAVDAREFDRASELAHALFAAGAAHAKARGLILADTKYEFGVVDGKVVVMDEMHTPDSSRYWYADDYEARLARSEEPRSLDKEYVRRYLAEQCSYVGEGPVPSVPDEIRVEAATRYIANYELLTGREFEIRLEDPVARIARVLGAV